MRFQTEVVTSDSTGMIPLAEVKEYLRFSGTDQDTALQVMIDGAIKLAENYTRRSFSTKNINAQYSGLEIGKTVTLPLGDHRGTPVVNRVDADGTLTLLVQGTNYTITGLNRFKFKLQNKTFSTSGSTDALPEYRINYDAGLADPSTIDPLVKNAIFKIISDSFENRENSITMSINEIPQDAQLMLSGFRLY